MEHIIHRSVALDYILAGKALFTVQNSETLNRFTYKVVKDKKRECWYVRLMNGPSNENSYVYIGAIWDGYFRHTIASKVSITALSFRVFNCVYNQLKDQTLPKKLNIYHHGYCACCGRLITVPSSVSSGYGPTCLKFKKIK